MSIDENSTAGPSEATSGVAHGRPRVRLPRERGLSQDAEWCEAEVDGQWRRVRFHDYHEIYAVPGLYEALFYDHLGCDSPRVVVSLLRDAMAARGTCPSSLRALDFGAGNGMVGEALTDAGVPFVVGADILPEARSAAHRDRPGTYADYLVADFTALSESDARRLREHRLNALTVVAALGFGDVPTQAFATAFNAVEDGGWVAFNIRDLFLRSDDASGFAGLIRLMTDRGYLQVEMTRRYVHRRNVTGEPLEYVAFAGRKLARLPERLPLDLRGLVRAGGRSVATAATAAGATSAPAAKVRIRFEGVSVFYPEAATPAVDEVSLDVHDGELVALVGESGSGKSTLLKTVNRLVVPSAGGVLIDGERAEALGLHEHRRRVGYVIQGVGLFPHMTVAENVAVVPRLLGWDGKRIARRVDELLELIGLSPEIYRLRRPDELSGGQRQRVGFARALAAKPPVLLMDEPFGAVDPVTRRALQQELALIHRQLGLTSLLVTHDMAEALLLADRVAVMRAGRVIRVGTPAELLENPGHEYVERLLATPREQARRIESLCASATPTTPLADTEAPDAPTPDDRPQERPPEAPPLKNPDFVPRPDRVPGWRPE